MTKEELLESGVNEYPIAGHYFELLETLNPVDVKLYNRDGHVLHDDRQVEAGYFVDRRGVEPFARIELTPGASESVKFLVSDGLAGTRRAYVRQAQARTLELPGNVTVGLAEGAVLAAANRALVLFQSDPGNAGIIALGPVGVTLANAPVILAPGDLWREEIAASAAWRGISTVAAQTLRVMTAE